MHRNTRAEFWELPDSPSGPYALPPYFSIVVPVGEDRENLVTNPSFETDVVNWSAVGSPTFVRSNVPWAGAWGVELIPAVITDGVFYGGVTPLAFTAGVYAISAYFLGITGGVSYNFILATTAGVTLKSVTFKTTGRWQRVSFLYTEALTASRRLYITPSSQNTIGRSIYFDAVQVERCGTGNAFETTYFDGDSRDLLLPNILTYNPYYWNGVRHASKSTRSKYTRSGGRVINLRDLGFTLSAISGLGLKTPQNEYIDFSQLDGSQFSRSRKQDRSFTIAGRITQRSAVQLDQIFGSFARNFDVDSFYDRNPLILKYQPMDEDENPTGAELNIVCTYEGGLEGQRNNFNTEVFTASFRQSIESVFSHDDGLLLSSSSSLANANLIVRQIISGTWSVPGTTGCTGVGGAVTCIVKHPNGTIYVGGLFTDAGGSGADNAAIYDPIANTFSVVKSATAFNARVLAIAIDISGIVYFGGTFTNVDGIAAADGIVSYNPVTNTFAALGTGVGALEAVNALAIDSTGTLYAGGTFALMGGVANTSRIAKWNGAVWAALGTGSSGNPVNSLHVFGNYLYAGGTFAAMGGVANTSHIARWNLTTLVWSTMGDANSIINAIKSSPSGQIYAGGNFTTIGGVAISYLAVWNGVGWSQVGLLDAQVYSIAFLPNGSGYIGGAFTTVGTFLLPDRVSKFSGNSFQSVGIDFPGAATVLAIFIDPENLDLYLGHDTAGTATIESQTTVNNDGTGIAYPIITIAASTSSRLYSIANLTTRQQSDFNHTLLTGETITIDFDPRNGSILSTFQQIVSVANFTNIFLSKGSNIISVLATGTVITTIRWHQSFLSTSDAIGVI